MIGTTVARVIKSSPCSICVCLNCTNKDCIKKKWCSLGTKACYKEKTRCTHGKRGRITLKQRAKRVKYMTQLEEKNAK